MTRKLGLFCFPLKLYWDAHVLNLNSLLMSIVPPTVNMNQESITAENVFKRTVTSKSNDYALCQLILKKNIFIDLGACLTPQTSERKSRWIETWIQQLEVVLLCDFATALLYQKKSFCGQVHSVWHQTIFLILTDN